MTIRQPERASEGGFGPFARQRVTYRVELTASPFDLVTLLVCAQQMGAQVNVLDGQAGDDNVWVGAGGVVCSTGPKGDPRRLVYQVAFNHTASQIEAHLAAVRAYGGSVSLS